MKSTLYSSLLSRLKNKHAKLATRFHRSVKEGEFQKQRYRKRKDAIERLKSLEKRIHGLSQESGFKVALNYKHWAVALAVGAVVATTNPVQAQEVDLSQPTIVGNAYLSNVLLGDIDNDGDVDIFYISYIDDPIILRNQGGFNFTPTPLGNTNGIVQNSLLADMDGDGDLDIFMQNGYDGNIAQVFVNDGAGNFATTAATIPTVDLEGELKLTGDIDGDGDLDFVAETRQLVSPYNRYVTLFPNNSFDFSDTTAIKGTYVFQPNTDLIGLIDSDGDDNLDILLKAYIISTGTPLQVFTNDGAGNFSYASPYTPVFNAYNVGDTLDIDNDGDTEIVIPFDSYPNPYVRILINGGAGGNLFSSGNILTLNNNNDINDVFPIDINNDGLDEFVVNTEADSTFVFETSVGGFVTSQVAKFKGQSIPEDLDGDGDADLLFGGGSLTLYENEGAATFNQYAELLTTSIIYDLDAVDIDGDGDMDIVTASPTQSRVWENDGAGNFTIGQELGPYGKSVSFGNLDGDADLEMIMGREGDYGDNFGFEIWDNSGGTLSVIDTIGRGNWSARQVFVENIDADADLEILVFARYTGDGTNNVLRPFDNQGGLNFIEIPPATYGNHNLKYEASRMDVGDLDGDMDVDVIVGAGNYDFANEEIFINDGTGVFVQTEFIDASSSYETGDVDLADFDGDGDLDLFATSGQDHSLWLNDTDTLIFYSQIATSYAGQSTVGDVDGDGDVDIIIGGYLTYPTIFLNNGDSTFTQDADVPALADEYSKTVIADIDGDGDNDIIFGGYYTGLKVIFNQALAPEPDINIQGNGMDIASGDDTPDTGDDTDFGSVILGESGQVTFTIQNVGGVVLNISDIEITGTNAADFSIPIIPSTVGSAASETFDVNFDPSAEGLRTATIQISSDDPDEAVYTFDIAGTGLVVPEIDIVGAGDIDVLDGDITPDLADGTDFGTVIAGTLNSQTFRIQNNGTADLSITSITLSGSEAANFAITGITTPNTIANGSELTFDLEFNPSGPGTSLATVTIESDDDDEGTYTFDVVGNAISPEINLEGNSFTILSGDNTPNNASGTDFGLQIIGDTPIKSTFVIENNGDADLNVSSIQLSGAGSTEFEVFSEVTPFVVAMGATSSFEVDFNPTNSGAANATVTIENDDLDEGTYTFDILGIAQTAQEINVQGNGNDIASGDVTPETTDGTNFGSITVGQQATSNFVIQNTGETDLVVSDIQLTGADATDFSLGAVGLPNTITGGNSLTINVTYSASAFVTSNATIEITNDDADEGVYVFDISGTGKAPGITEQDSMALVSIYNDLDGTNWTNSDGWLVEDTRAENWYGVNVEGDRVTKLFLSSNNLTGTIPAEIGDLTALTDLYLANNSLSGEIPSEIGTTSLDTLVMSGNQLSGSIPEEMYNLTDLLRLSISQNDLTGSVSSSIANLENLNFIALWGNPFTGGTIPSEFWTITSLQYVYMGTSDLSGDISSFTNLTNLVEFWMDQSNFTGSITSNVGNLTQLELLDVSDNQLDGMLPTELASLSNLDSLEINNNAFTDLPDMSGSNLQKLNVSENLFDFADLEPNASISKFFYAPQNNTNVPLEISVNGGTAFAGEDTIIPQGDEVNVTAVTGAAASNVYSWTLNGSEVPAQTQITYSIPSIERADMGDYQLTVTNDVLTDLEFTSDPVEILASAILTVSATDGTNPIEDNINAYLFPLNSVPDTLKFEGDLNLNVTSDAYSFPPAVLGDYLVAIESVEPFLDANGTEIPDAVIPSYFGDVFLSNEAKTLSLEADEEIQIVAQLTPPTRTAATGQGVVGGTMEEDFGDDEARVDARRRAKKRKCGLRRRRTGGRTLQDEFELIAYGETNDNGEFEYGFLPEGTYRFFVEYPGIPLDESAFVEFEIGEAGVSDDTFVLAVFASPEGITIEIVLGLTSDYFVDFNIYPNPTSDLLNIKYAEIKRDDVRMEVVNMDGKIMYTKPLSRSSDQVQYDMSLLSAGQYFVRFIGGGNEEPLVYKVIKK